jgi:hypothetical protein
MSLATGFVPPCIPTRTAKPSAGPDWVHEIKRTMATASRFGAMATRCASSRAAATTGAPAIRRPPPRRPSCAPIHSRSTARRSSVARTASPSSTRSATPDRQRGHAVRLRPPGARRPRTSALPLVDRKRRLARLLGKRRIGIVLSQHIDEDGAAISSRPARCDSRGSCRSD